ncbi:DUF3347 domain-containing protein [Pedobacter polaris]|uniref:DUF3347 domain-containing protein n=1 Tax=Pedobacter polaris TaxID=2571273 RepID=A0A4U1CSN1_9SPHI|nr:DUF3347 domain-containing protein [Pedobacter polaris]TKC10045.1 DUF3347 domain-containing protein [Pedobacter polaris]
MKNYFGIAAIMILMACNNNANKSAETKDTVANKTDKVAISNVSFKDEKVQNLYHSYISLKDALVASKLEDAKKEATILADQLKTYSGCENTALIANKIKNAKDIVEQRKQFTALSSDVIALFKHTELASGTIFIQHCPMANDGDGGDWLASEKKIQNPYYGSEMMECGAVIEEIKIK